MRNMYMLSLGLLLALTENIVMTCDTGFVKKRGKCEDVNECESTTPNLCGENATCTNTHGSYYCRCEGGLTPTHNFTQTDAIKCQDINECADGSDVCGPNAECINTVGGYSCTCETGYFSSNGNKTFIAGQGVQCIDINECADGSDVCGRNAERFNSEGGFSCTCKSGYFSSNGNNTCIAGQGVRCIELKCDTFISESKASQALSPALTELESLMNNSCLEMSESESGMKEHFTQEAGERLLKAFLGALDSLLSAGFQGNNNHTVSALFNIVENMLKLIGPLLSESQTKRSSTEIEVELLVKKGSSQPEGDFNISTSRTQIASHWDTATGDTFLGFTAAALLSYKRLGKSLNHHFDHLETQQKQTFKINSEVLTATVSNTDTASLTKPVTLTFSHLERSNENHICVFWDPALEGGAWSKEGCTTVSSSDVQTVCSCNHLSSFAVLMAVGSDSLMDLLGVINLVCVPVGLVFFSLALLTFALCQWSPGVNNVARINICVSMLLAHLLFLLTQQFLRHKHKVVCAVISGVLHFLFLSGFVWMFIESVLLFIHVKNLSQISFKKRELLSNGFLCMIGYMVALVVVAVSAGVRPDGYGSQECWITIEDGFIWSFLGPVCVILALNTILFINIIISLISTLKNLNAEVSQIKQTKIIAFKTLAQFVILGCSWILGFFNGRKELEILFLILNSQQGTFIFLVYCVLNDEVRQQYRKCFRCLYYGLKPKHMRNLDEDYSIQIQEINELSKLQSISTTTESTLSN